MESYRLDRGGPSYKLERGNATAIQALLTGKKPGDEPGFFVYALSSAATGSIFRAMGTFEAISTYVIKNDRLKTVLLGLIFLAGGFHFWLWMVGNPFNDLALIRRGVTTRGVITDFQEEVEEVENAGRGKLVNIRYATYTFQSADGRTITGHADDHRAALPDYLKSIEVEYLPDDPTVNRIKGASSNCLTISDWLLRKVGAGGILLVMFLAPGMVILYREFYPKPKN